MQNWYGKITTDEGFVAEIIHTVAHCTRALEQRLRKVDLESLLLDEIPDLLDRHITGNRHGRCAKEMSNAMLTQVPGNSLPRIGASDRRDTSTSRLEGGLPRPMAPSGDVARSSCG